MLTKTGEGRAFKMCTKDFFPLDGKSGGWPLGDRELELGHKFWFTTEVHTFFQYGGGEQFHFSGDDDFWVFIGDQLALDLGGVHMQAEATLVLDEFPYDHEDGHLGLRVGETYPIHFFHAERHTDQSNFCVETNIDFQGQLVMRDEDHSDEHHRYDKGSGSFWDTIADLLGNLGGFGESAWAPNSHSECRFDVDLKHLMALDDSSELNHRLKQFLISYHPDKIVLMSPACDPSAVATKFRDFMERDFKGLKRKLRRGRS